MKESRAYELRDQYAKEVQKHCIVKAEWYDYDGWLDGFQAKFFVVSDKGILRVIKVTEAGAFWQCESGGFTKFRFK